MGKKLNLFPHVGLSREESITVQRVYKIFRSLCFERLMTIFVYENTPFPAREIEYRLFKSGAVAIVQDKKVGTMATWANLSGVTEYADVFTDVTYAAPTAAGGTVKIGQRAVVAYNNSMHLQLQTHVDLYASLLAHAYMTIKISLVNQRYQDIIAVSDDQTKNSVEEWYRSLYSGKPIAILQDSLIGLGDSVMNLSPSNKTTNVIELINAYDELWRAFYRDIGIRFSKEKKGNMVTDEVNSDEQLLLYNIDDMLRQRQQMCVDYNELFVRKNGWQANEMLVKLNPIFSIIRDKKEEGVTTDEQQVSDNQ